MNKYVILEKVSSDTYKERKLKWQNLRKMVQKAH